MLLTEKIKLEGSRLELLNFLKRFNAACNYASGIAFQNKLWHWFPLQKATYYKIREDYLLPSAATLCVIRKVAASYKDRNKRSINQI